MEENVKLMIVVAVILYVLMPIDVAPGPIDDAIVTLIGLLLTAVPEKEKVAK